MRKRLFDLIASAVGLVILAPVFLLIAVLIKLESAGPVFFRQERVGRFGKPFRIHKFRTMITDAERRGLQITVMNDARVTRVGRVLRRHKLDELAQLIDVLVGNMSLVGPRPEVPRYVAFYPPEARAIVLSVKPGITDRASIEYKDENEIVGKAEDPHQAYVSEILPVKISYYVDYVKSRSFSGDIGLIFATFKALFDTGAAAEQLCGRLVPIQVIDPPRQKLHSDSGIYVHHLRAVSGNPTEFAATAIRHDLGNRTANVSAQ
jgi:lipopolysaccharide/colanic/teichoic acid biosynthesis glycosyltransferase